MTILRWLFSEAGAGWTFGIVSTTAFIISLRRHARPPRLVARETYHASLVRVREEIRNAIEVRFRGHVITDLGHVGFQLSNSGSAPIKDALIRVRFSRETKILDAGPSERDPVPRCTVVPLDNEVSISIPYLNPVRDHSHNLSFSVLVSGPTQIDAVIGAGEGWSAQLVSAPTWRQATRGIELSLLASLLWLLAYSFLVIPPLNRYLGITNDELSLRVALVILPMTLPVFGVTWLLIRTKRRFPLSDPPIRTRRRSGR